VRGFLLPTLYDFYVHCNYYALPSQYIKAFNDVYELLLMVRYNKTMPDKEYVPDQIDKDWLSGAYGPNGMEDPPLLNPHHDNYEARMAWRSKQPKMNQPDRELKDFAVGIVIMIVIILFAFWVTRHDNHATDQYDPCQASNTC